MDNEPDKIDLSIKGKTVFTAKDIQKASDQFEILNPDEYITEVNSKGRLDIELRIGIGKGMSLQRRMKNLIFLKEHCLLIVFLKQKKK